MAVQYSSEQISQFLQYIGIPERFHLGNHPPLDIAFLTALHTHFITTIPYENLNLHYSRSHEIVLDPQILFQKTVTANRGRGGYCLENAILFNHVLRALGFKAYLVGGRMRSRMNGVPQGDYSGW